MITIRRTDGQIARHVGERRQVVRVDDQHRCTGIVDDRGHLRWCQTPVHGDVDGADQRATEQEVEVRDAVAIEKSDPVADAEPVAHRRLRHAAGDVEFLGPGTSLRAQHQHFRVPLLARQVPQQARHGVAVLFGDIDARCHQ